MPRWSRGPRPIADEQVYDNTVEALLAAIEETPEDVRCRGVPSRGAVGRHHAGCGNSDRLRGARDGPGSARWMPEVTAAGE